MGIPSTGKLRRAVKPSSMAEAKALTIELRFLRKMLVTIPTRALLIMIAMTRVWETEVRDS